MEIGLVQIYTGDGKGKTTAAFGLALRACGRNLKVIIVQFLKNEDTGEIYSLKEIKNVEIYRFNSQKKFVWNMNESEIELLKKETLDGLQFVKDIIINNKCDVLILDEVVHCINKDYIKFNEMEYLIKNKPKSMELVLTGRDAKKELIEIADLVTEMKCVKHPYEKGINARIGIEK